ncbi:MerR family transcriptional regulator [Halobacillus amylolyticus]|uniref:MerR family transcriptional regulator n=1 Tax=Halobacillus amylolyticus TaxID=2932259 RepID=A0ABY4HG11_9BACI|nr:MerR family transcriptional regulator [Halobacillus amylolyticus]UOR13837.1 MerR family transcriptional regulator [Halobacillus amylolyticus]
MMEELQRRYYYIKEVAGLTGLSEQLIRKWENRYHVIQPQRLDNGYRLYTFEDLSTLKELKALRDQGKSMKQAIHSVVAEKNSTYTLRSVEKSPNVKKMIEKGTIYDEKGLESLLQQSHHQYGLDLFLQNTVQPFLEEIGVLWENGEWDESQETVSSLVVKDFLTQLSRNFKHNLKAPHALGFCLPGELHEIPLQILLLQLQVKGWRTTRVGASPKLSSIERLIEHMRPQKVLFSASTGIPFQQNENLLEQLDQLAERHASTSFYIGGRGVYNYKSIMKPKHMDISFTIEDIIS